MAKILIIYSTTDGHTRKICERLRGIIEKRGNLVSIVSIQAAPDTDLGSFDKIVLGASIRYGKHRKEVYDFIESNTRTLEEKPNAFFSVNIVARKADKNTPDTNPYVRKFLASIPWKPMRLAVFAGKLDYQRYRFIDRLMIRLIMRITNGPTDPRTNIEFTDWNKVDAFGETISDLDSSRSEPRLRTR